jgi:hypothetical protein
MLFHYPCVVTKLHCRGRPQASAAGIPSGRHHQYLVRLQKPAGLENVHLNKLSRYGYIVYAIQAGDSTVRERSLAFGDRSAHIFVMSGFDRTDYSCRGTPRISFRYCP